MKSKNKSCFGLILIAILIFSTFIASGLFGIVSIAKALGVTVVNGVGYPGDIAAGDGRFFITDQTANLVKGYDQTTGALLWTEDVYSPVGIDFGYENGNPRLYVVNTLNNRIEVLNPQTGQHIYQFGISGFTPSYVATHPNQQNLLVVDTPNRRIHVFNLVSLTETGQFSFLYYPYGIDVDDNGYLYVGFTNESGTSNAVQKFLGLGGGSPLWSIASAAPFDVASDGSDLYVAQVYWNRIAKYSALDGSFEGLWGSTGSNVGQFNTPLHVAVDSGKIYVADTGNHRIQIFNSATSASVSITPTPAVFGQAIQISGQIKPAAIYTLTIEAVDPNSNALTVGTYTTDTAGRYQVSWIPPVPGTGYSLSIVDTSDFYNPTVLATTNFDVSAQDWWTMFRHDSTHTGYSTSPAPNTNDLRWTYAVGSAVSYSSPAVDNGKVYFGSSDGNIHCINSVTGASIWTYLTGGFVDSSPAVAYGNVYDGSGDGFVYCLNAVTGSFGWSYDTGSTYVYSPTVDNGRVYVGCMPGNVYCLDALTGGLLWTYVTSNTVGDSLAVANGKVYVGCSNGNVYCLDALIGGLLWTYSTGAQVTSSPAVANGKVYVGSDDYNVYCLEATSGAFVWSYATGGTVGSSPAVTNGKVYVGSWDGNVYCLDAVTGSLLWTYSTSNTITASSPAVADGKVFVCSASGTLYCLDATTGGFVWSYAAGGYMGSSPAIADGKVFVGSSNGNVYAFGPATFMRINNHVMAAPNSDWQYVLSQGGTPVKEFPLTPLPTSDEGISVGTKSYTDLATGSYVLSQSNKYGWQTTSVQVNGLDAEMTENGGITAVNINLGTGPCVVDFYVRPYDAEGKSGGAGSSTVSTIYNIPCLRAVPVQSSWDPNFKAPGWTMELVKDKPMKILVNLTDALTSNLISPDSTPITISLSFPQPSLFADSITAGTTGNIVKNVNNITIINTNPPSVPFGTYPIQCDIYKGSSTTSISTTITQVTVKETPGLSLYYLALSRAEYGSETIDPGLTTMRQNCDPFVNSVFPVPSVVSDYNKTTNIGHAKTDTDPVYQNDPKAAMLIDCQLAELQAQLAFGNEKPSTIGVAIGPYQSAQNNYFKYHGATAGGKTAVGVSFGSSTKGVVVMDGYYSAVAHEIGHTFGIYYPGLEQYDSFNPGISTSGYSPAENKWRFGTDIMGLSPLRSTTSIWVNSATTYVPILNQLKVPNDPQTLLVNGIIFKDDTFVQAFNWYSVPYGTPDTVPTGRFGIRFTTNTGTVETRFDAPFSMNLDPGIEMGQDLPTDFSGFGVIPTNFAGFAFAVAYPVGTINIELVDHSPPEGKPEVIKTISPQEVVSTVGFGGFSQPINQDGSSQFKLGSVVPVKFQLKDLQGQFITNAKATLNIAKLTNSILGTDVEAISTAQATTGNLFRYDTSASQYIFNLATKGLSKGTYQLTVTIDDSIIKTVQISLK
jgi:outer membrane protein assembly factor BamB